MMAILGEKQQHDAYEADAAYKINIDDSLSTHQTNTIFVYDVNYHTNTRRAIILHIYMNNNSCINRDELKLLK